MAKTATGGGGATMTWQYEWPPEIERLAMETVVVVGDDWDRAEQSGRPRRHASLPTPTECPKSLLVLVLLPPRPWMMGPSMYSRLLFLLLFQLSFLFHLSHP